MEFLEPGEKIRILRRRLDMSQLEFQDESMTRSYFGMIENGKRNINADIAKRIVDKLVARAKELEVDINISVEELLKTPQENADAYCTELLNNSPTEENIKNVLGIAKKFKLLKVLADAYRLLGDSLYKSGEYQSAFGEYSKALDNYINISLREQLPYLYNKLGLCKYMLLEYEDAVLYFDRACYNAITYSSLQSEKEALYNLAEGHKKLEKYSEAMGYLGQLLEKFPKASCSLEEYVNILVLKANCLEYLNEIDKVNKVYEELEGIIPDKEYELVAYVCYNRALAFREQTDLEKANQYLDKSIVLREAHDKQRLSHSFIGKAEILIKQGKLKEALDLVQKGIELAELYKDMEHAVKGCNILAKVYEALGENDAAEYTLLKRLSLVGRKNNFVLIETYIMLQKLYLKLHRYGDLAKLLESTESSVAKSYSGSVPYNNKNM